MLAATVVNGWPELLGHAAHWSRILESLRAGVSGPDATCAPVWARALAATHLKDRPIVTLAIARGERIVALAPTFIQTSGKGLLRKRELRLITEAHAGRTALLVEGNDVSVATELLSRMTSELPAWDVFVLSTVAGSAGHSMLLDAAQAAGIPVRCLAQHTSPYIELGSTWDETLGALPKKLRWTIRKGEKDLRALGQLAYEEITTLQRVPALLAAMYEIELASWKEEAGSSITAQAAQREFYEASVALAAEAGVLSGHVLSLDGKPIAYILGIAADGAFLDQKESFVLAHSEHSPGHVLKRFALESLIGRGVRIYDLMGECEPYKMRWTSRTYTRYTLALYNRSFGGRVNYLRTLLGRKSTLPQRT